KRVLPPSGVAAHTASLLASTSVKSSQTRLMHSELVVHGSPSGTVPPSITPSSPPPVVSADPMPVPLAPSSSAMPVSVGVPSSTPSSPAVLPDPPSSSAGQPKAGSASASTKKE